MNKILFKNNILNTVLGFLLIAFTILAYFLGWYEDFLPIIVGVILILLSVKRFIYTYQKLVSKKATLILAGELLLDVLFSILLIIYQGNIAVFAGIIIYIRGFTYLMINHVVKRKVQFYQYIINIGFITLGGFFMFTGIPMYDYFILITTFSVGLIGLTYFLFGIASLIEGSKKGKTAAKPAPAPSPNPANTAQQAPKPAPVAKAETPQVKEKVEVKVDYSKMTLKELQVIAKNRNLTGISKLNKSELIEVLNNKGK